MYRNVSIDRNVSIAMPGTLKDIAQQLNLSISTVSYALNGGPKPVSQAVRREVVKLAREMGYRPNRLARSLATGRSHTLGIVPMFVNSDPFLQPFQLLALNGIFNSASSLSQDVMVFSARDHNHSHVSANDLMDCRADGLIFLAPRPWSQALRCIVESDVPYVVLFEDCGTASFIVDNVAGVSMALDHLVAMGHRRIMHVTGDILVSDGRQRRDAFLKGMATRGLPVPGPYLVEGDFLTESGYAAGLAFLYLSPRPTAVCCGNEEMAIGFVEALHHHQVCCPDDVNVVCLDSVALSRDVTPPLTAVRQPVQAMAGEAVRALVRRIESGQPIENRVFKPDFVIRGSTAQLPMEESLQ